MILCLVCERYWSVFFFCFVFCVLFVFLAVLESLWDLSSLARDWTQDHGSESAKFSPLGCQGIPKSVFFFSCNIFDWFLYQCSISLIEWIGKCSLASVLWKSLCTIGFMGSPLQTNLQVADFQRCRYALHQCQAWVKSSVSSCCWPFSSTTAFSSPVLYPCHFVPLHF